MESSYDLPFPHPRHHPTNSELFSSRSLVNSLDQEIGNLRQKIEELQARIQHLQHKRENHASYISHLRCLPPEILCSIVQIAVEGGVRLLTLRQICGTIRYVVNGMTTVWSKVALGHFNLGEIEYCRNADQLNLALKRAGATPLDLYIARKISLKERLLLESHPYPIQSLNISQEFRRGLVEDIRGISLRGVRRLHFTRVSYAEIGEIMDSALESTHEEMDIRIFYLEGNLATNFLKHDLFQRASRLEVRIPSLASSAYGSVRENKYFFPHLKRLEFEGNVEFFCNFDISHLQCLRLEPSGREVVAPNFFPTHLTELRLENARFTAAVRPNQAHCLPQLALLALAYVTVEGVLSQYLQLPKLRHLDLRRAVFSPLNDATKGAGGMSDNKSIQRPDLVSLQGLPALNILSFSSMLMDELVLEQIKSYPRLHTLSIGFQLTETFKIHSFLKTLEDQASFPALSRLEFFGYWGKHIAHEDLVVGCAARRPYMNVFNNIK